MNNLVYAIVSFIVSLFFILFGVISALFPWVPAIRTEVLQFLLEGSYFISLFGIGLVAIGLAMFASVILNIRHRRYVLRRGNRSVVVDENVIDGYLRVYWKRLFPREEIPHHIVIKRNKIFVSADLPQIDDKEQEALLNRIHKDLMDIFSDILGYQDELHLSVSFASPGTEQHAQRH